MKSLLIIAFTLISSGAFAQTDTTSKKKPDPAKPVYTVKASCGQCKFGLTGSGCDLAVRFEGKAYYVDGTAIDEHGDSHADDGFCNAIRKAKVQGEVVNGRFKVSYFQLLPEKKKKR